MFVGVLQLALACACCCIARASTVPSHILCEGSSYGLKVYTFYQQYQPFSPAQSICNTKNLVLPDISLLANADTKRCVLSAISQTTPAVGFWVTDGTSSVCQTLDVLGVVTHAKCMGNEAFVCLDLPKTPPAPTPPPTRPPPVVVPTRIPCQGSSDAAAVHTFYRQYEPFSTAASVCSNQKLFIPDLDFFPGTFACLQSAISQTTPEYGFWVSGGTSPLCQTLDVHGAVRPAACTGNQPFVCVDYDRCRAKTHNCDLFGPKSTCVQVPLGAAASQHGCAVPTNPCDPTNDPCSINNMECEIAPFNTTQYPALYRCRCGKGFLLNVHGTGCEALNPTTPPVTTPTVPQPKGPPVMPKFSRLGCTETSFATGVYHSPQLYETFRSAESICRLRKQILPDINLFTGTGTKACVLTAFLLSDPKIGHWMTNGTSRQCLTLDVYSSVKNVDCRGNQPFVCLELDSCKAKTDNCHLFGPNSTCVLPRSSSPYTQAGCDVPTNPCGQAVDPCKKVNMRCQKAPFTLHTVRYTPLYQCGCGAGFRPNVLGTGCEDINECTETTICPAVAECNNTIGSYACWCSGNYYLDGDYCLPKPIAPPTPTPTKIVPSRILCNGSSFASDVHTFYQQYQPFFTASSVCKNRNQVLPDINLFTNIDTGSCILTAIRQTTPKVGFWVTNGTSPLCLTLNVNGVVKPAVCTGNQAFVCVDYDPCKANTDNCHLFGSQSTCVQAPSSLPVSRFACAVPTDPCGQAIDPCEKVHMQCQVAPFNTMQHPDLYRCGCKSGFRPNVLGSGCEDLSTARPTTTLHTKTPSTSPPQTSTPATTPPTTAPKTPAFSRLGCSETSGAPDVYYGNQQYQPIYTAKGICRKRNQVLPDLNLFTGSGLKACVERAFKLSGPALGHWVTNGMSSQCLTMDSYGNVRSVVCRGNQAIVCLDVDPCKAKTDNCHLFGPTSTCLAARSGVPTSDITCSVPTNPCSQAVDPCKKVNMQCQVVAAPLYRCGCTKGFRPNVLGTGCEDINECTDTDLCGAKCANTIGSYVCYCDDGFFWNGNSCRPLVATVAPTKKAVAAFEPCSESSAASDVYPGLNSSQPFSVAQSYCRLQNQVLPDINFFTTAGEKACTIRAMSSLFATAAGSIWVSNGTSPVCLTMDASGSVTPVRCSGNQASVCLALDECKAKTASCQLFGSTSTCVPPPSNALSLGAACAVVSGCGTGSDNCIKVNMTCQRAPFGTPQHPNLFRCGCQQGFRPNVLGTGCEDINECTETSQCPAACVNTRGSFQCTCPQGSYLDGDKCTPTTTQPTTSQHTTSRQTTAQPAATQPTSKTVGAFEPCSESSAASDVYPGLKSSQPFSVAQSYCRLQNQVLPDINFFTTAGEKACIIRAMSSLFATAAGSIWVSNGTSPVCLIMDASGSVQPVSCSSNQASVCLALDECKAKTANCQLIGSQATCVSPPSTVQTYWSACAVASGCGKGSDNCKKVNMTCQQAPFTTSQHPSLYRCGCQQGFRPNVLGTGCEDINECSETTMCPASAACTNTRGSYLCVCPGGYYLHGDKCTSLCSTNPCHSRAGCSNGPTNITCTCHSEYTGDGVSNCDKVTTTLPKTQPTTTTPSTTAYPTPSATAYPTLPSAGDQNISCPGAAIEYITKPGVAPTDFVTARRVCVDTGLEITTAPSTVDSSSACLQRAIVSLNGGQPIWIDRGLGSDPVKNRRCLLMTASGDNVDASCVGTHTVLCQKLRT